MTRRLNRTFCFFILIASLGGYHSTQARGTYETPDAFLNQAFDTAVPSPKRLMIKGDLKKRIRDILEHDLPARRVRYWQEGDRTVWILEEIGKTKPITTGLIVNHGKLEALKVLTFRESRGSEIRYPFFTDQFNGASLTSDDDLDRNIDGISGATLSVWAMKKLARVAMVLHDEVSTTN
jgi:hypothetical protein